MSLSGPPCTYAIELAVRAPREAAVAPVGLVVGALEGRQLPRRRRRRAARSRRRPSCRCDPGRAPLGDEGDRLAVGRPGGQLLVVVAGGQLLDLAAVAVEEVEVLAPRSEVAVAVELELEAVDDDRLLRLRLLASSLSLSAGAFGSGSLTTSTRRLPSGDQAKSSTPPFCSVNFSASPPERGRIHSCVVVVVVAAVREERQEPAVRAPARRPSRTPCPSSGGRFPCRPSSSSRCGSRACLP